MSGDRPVWEIDTKRLSDAIAEAVRNAHTEEDVKMRVEPILRTALAQAGIDVEIVEYEKTTALRSKRMDAVYGSLIIEYEGPGKLGKARERNASVAQAEEYLELESRRFEGDREAFLEKAVGVCIDGTSVVFVRYSRLPGLLHLPVAIRSAARELFPQMTPKAGFQVQGPFPIKADSLANLLVYARSAARRRLTAEELASVFGPERDVARTAVSEFYTAAMRGQRRGKRVATFFSEWDRLFGVVYGEAMDAAGPATEEAAQVYHVPAGARTKPLIFAIHTYYALLMKLIAVELAALQRDIGIRPFVAGLGMLDAEALKARLAALESGHEFQSLGIENFLEADFFSWYLDVWDEPLANAVRAVVRALAEFEPATPVLAPDWTRDLLQNLYEYVVPRKLRHSLGEYYTPDWLASHVLDLSGYDGNPARRLLDPACGSGTFLVQAVRRVLAWVERQEKVDPGSIGRQILENVAGFDLNPLAVLAARTNYLIAFAPLLPFVRPISLPVYLCDSVVPPDREQARDGALFSQNCVVFRTQEHDFTFPLWIRDRGRINAFTGEVMVGLRSKLDPAAFRRGLCRRMELTPADADRLEAVYAHIKTLDDEGRDGIWAHYIKNAFAPVYLDRFDFVVGNPPWIRWDYLSQQYRARTLPLWKQYGLFSIRGHEARLGQGKKDFSMLFTYAAADRYLRDAGVLTFVITYEVFKSKGAGEGFRRFRIGEQGPDLQVDFVEDMVHLQPFHAANKTSVFRMRRGHETTYPVVVTEWTRRPGVGRIPPAWTRDQVLAATERRQLEGTPIDQRRPVSAWRTATRSDITSTGGLSGSGAYRGIAGVYASPYGIYWLKVLGTRPDNRIIVQNLFDRGDEKIDPVQVAIEPDLVYPAVAGRNITRYGVKDFFYVLVTQDLDTRRGIDEDGMLTDYPLTYAYLSQFRDILVSRAAYKKYFHAEIGPQGRKRTVATAPFYSIYNTSRLSVAPHRVTWKRMASRLDAVVLSQVLTPFGPKPMVSTDTTAFIPTDDAREAHYLCALLNSAVVGAFVRSFSAAGRGFGTPSVIQNVAFPKFDPNCPVHRELSELSFEAHRIVAAQGDVDEIQAQIDQAARRLWNIAS